MKSYTDLSQSKKLAEFLPLESADMRYEYPSIEKDEIQEPMNGFHISSFNWFKESDSFIYFPCWSLAALLGVLPEYIDYDTIYHPHIMRVKDNNYMALYSSLKHSEIYDNPVDACVEMIINLHKMNLL